MEKTMQNPKLIPVPFANSGIKDDIPKVKSTSMSDEKASWEAGFPEATMLPVYAGGLPPDGKDFNGVLNQISENLVFQSKGGRYKFDPDFALSIGGYPKGATLQTNDESAEYQSLIDNNLVNFNTATPEEIAQAWRITGLGDAIEVLNGKLDKASVKNELGLSQTEVVSQRVVTELGSGVVGSFENGLNYIEELTSSDQQVTLENEFGKQPYYWDGDLPKQVPAGSTPETTGGIKSTDNPNGLWVSVGDASLRSDIKNVDGASYVGSTNYAGLRGYTGANRKIDVYGRNNIFDGGDGIFILDATDVSTVDNDVTILVDALNRRWKREVKNGHYDARWAGVVADGITDNTEAFAKLSATIKKQHSVMLVPAGVIKTGSIKLPVEYCEIRGAGKFSTVIQFIDKSNSIKIMEACKVSHVTISGVGAWLGANAHDVLILDDKEHNRSDVDLYVDNCLLNNTKFVARIFGRGFELTNCNTNDLSEYILDLQFPEPFEPGPDPSLHSIIEGMRHYKFLNNRIHYAGKGLINNTGYNAVNAKNFLISGNSFEGNITILNGYMKGAVITGNEFVHGYNQRIFNATGLEDIIFTDNNVDFKIGGYSNQTQTQIFSSNGTFKNITIKDNGFKNLNRQVVYLHGTGDKINDRSDIIISGNSYDNCFGSLTHLFELQSGSIDRLTVDETLKSPSESWMPIFQSIGMYAIKNYSVSAKATGSNEVHNLHSSYSTGGMKKQGTYNGNGSSQVIKVGFMPRNVLVRGSNGSMTIITPEMPNTGGATMGDINNRSFTVSGLVNTNGQQYVWVAES